MEKVLFSPIGGTDPISNDRDGAMLHICRVYKPDIVYLYLSKEMMAFHRQNNRYLYCLEKLGELLGHTFHTEIIAREDLEEVQIFDPFIDEYRDILQYILKKHKECELYLNVSSGTPAMKSALQILGVLSEETMKIIQVNTPEKKINPHKEKHDDYDVDIYWECNEDNDPEKFKNRCHESQTKNLLDEMKIQNILRHIKSYDYIAALREAGTLAEPLSKRAQDYLEAAHYRTQLHIYGIQEKLGKDKESILPIRDEKSRNIFEHLLNLQCKLIKEEYVDFIRGLTPVVVDLFQVALKEMGGISYKEYTYVDQKGVEKWDQAKVKQNPELYQAFLNAFGLGVSFGPIYSSNLLPCIEAFSKNEEIIKLSKELRQIEEGTRNLAAHEIVSVTKRWVVKHSGGYTPEEIFEKLKRYSQILDLGIRSEYWNSYDDMNRILIDLIKRR